MYYMVKTKKPMGKFKRALLELMGVGILLKFN